jgi:hypothetical protein
MGTLKSKYYKAVKIEDGKLVSAFVADPDLRLEYKVGEWVEPITDHKEYGIFVTKDSDPLRSIVFSYSVSEQGTAECDYSGDKFELYECEVRLPKRKLTPKVFFLERVPKRFMKKSRENYFKGLNANTVVVNACKLTRKLGYDEIIKLQKQ